jgi:hypothetical protein
MKTTTIMKVSELGNLLNSYMEIFCKNGRNRSESTFAVYYPWIERTLQKADGDHTEPVVKVFADDIEQMKKEIEIFGEHKKAPETTRDQKFLIELKAEARRYCNENFTSPTDSDYLTIEGAMIIGAGLQLKEFGSTPFC